MLTGIRTVHDESYVGVIPLSNLNSDFHSSLLSLISAILVSLTGCYNLGWIWQRKGEMWEEWRLKVGEE
ncbi:hypothetical protein Bca101_062475 [Brassica carinata]